MIHSLHFLSIDIKLEQQIPKRYLETLYITQFQVFLINIK